MTKQVLLTGGAGYIGSHIYVALIAAGYDVTIYDNFDNASKDVPDRLEQITGQKPDVIEADILDRASLRACFGSRKFDAVIHLAARKSVAESVARPLDYFETNIAGIIILLQEMERAGLKDIVFSSSATVYGHPEQKSLPETAQVSHTNPYGFTKLTSEQILSQAQAADAGLNVGILRYFNPAGAHPTGLIGDDPNSLPNNLLPYLAEVALGNAPHLNVYGTDYDTPDGTGLRDYIHVDDLARGHVLSLATLLDKQCSHLVNLGTGRAVSVMEMLKAYSAACGRKLRHKNQPRRAGDVTIYCADPSLAKNVLGFETTKDVMDMCNSSWNWVQKNKSRNEMKGN